VSTEAGLDVTHYNDAKGQFRLLETMGSGVGLIDFDGDGWLDVFVAQGAPIPRDEADRDPSARLYRNNRDGSFDDVTNRAGVAFRGFGQGVAVGDYDADGFDDLFVAGFGGSALYRNRGDGTFADVTDAAGVRGSGWPSSCAFADLDADGDLDLYVVHYLHNTIDAEGRPTVDCKDAAGRKGYCPPQAFRPEPDVLYRNNGDGTFTDASEPSGVAALAGNGLGLAIADFDDDGRLDVFVADDQTPNLLWHNLGGLGFEEVAMQWGVSLSDSGEPRAGMGVAFGDYDDDGRDDLLVTNFYEEPNTLYRNVAPGLFQDATTAARLTVPSRGMLGFGTAFLDPDNDGRLDLFVANGHINDVRSLGIPYAMPPQFFRNLGGRFAEVSSGCGPYFEGRWLGRSAAVGDLDNDGDADVVVTHLGRHPALLRNDTPNAGHFLSLRLAGKAGAWSAVGTRVRATIGDRTLTRTVASGTSYLATSDLRILLGLGECSKVDLLELRWPSGAIQAFEHVPADQFLEIREGESLRPQRIEGREPSGDSASLRDRDDPRQELPESDPAADLVTLRAGREDDEAVKRRTDLALLDLLADSGCLHLLQREGLLAGQLLGLGPLHIDPQLSHLPRVGVLAEHRQLSPGLLDGDFGLLDVEPVGFDLSLRHHVLLAHRLGPLEPFPGARQLGLSHRAFGLQGLEL
jgi:hypothetical protein